VRFVCADGEEQFRAVLDDRPVREAGHELTWYDGRPEGVDEWERRLAGAEGAMLMWGMPEGALSASPGLRVVSFAGSGAGSYVPMPEAERCGVVVCNVPSYGANAIAEHAIALAFALARKVCEGDHLVRSGRWGPGALSGIELANRRLGVVGVGPIGARVIAIGRGLGMTVSAWTRSPTPERERELGVPFVPLDQLFAESDVVTLHLAHVPGTEGIIDARLLSLMQPHALLVNTARAQLIETDALVEALRGGRIGAAAIDAFEEEPLPPAHPLLAAPRLLMTPHVAFNTEEATAELVRATLDNLLAYAAGRPQNVYTTASP
jgi:phosphoglycerate dehydrogenase-like enzyme